MTPVAVRLNDQGRAVDGSVALIDQHLLLRGPAGKFDLRFSPRGSVVERFVTAVGLLVGQRVLLCLPLSVRKQELDGTLNRWTIEPVWPYVDAPIEFEGGVAVSTIMTAWMSSV